jgi:yecA family protein
VHGLLCGMLCADAQLDEQRWLDRLQQELPDPPRLSQAAHSHLRELARHTRSQLASEMLDFQPLLPDDQAALGDRAEALGQWCQGFLAGLGLAGLDRQRPLSPEAQEFLHDLSDISRVGFDTDDADETDEVALLEIIEYVRIGVLLVGQELHQPADLSRYWH